MIIYLSFLVLLSLIPKISSSEEALTFEEYFQFGKNVYTEKNWPDCVAFMKRAVNDFKQFEDDVVSCREKCERVVKPAKVDENWKIGKWHETSELALCLVRCKRDRFGDSRPPLRNMNAYYDMVERKPYQYMHYCYYKMNEFGMAVQSAYTFLVANPTDPDIVSSLEFYMKQPEYSNIMLIDMERKDYETKFISGVEAYDEQDWSRCVHEFETSLEKAMKQEKRCRLLCQDKVDWSSVDDNPEIDVLLASMRGSVVHCEHQCWDQLSRINGHNVGNLFAAHFEYLHFCQYKLLRGTEAAQSVANYLLFDDSPLMRRNKLLYLKQYRNPALFVPNEKIVKIYEARELERRYLDFIDRRFRLQNNELPPEQADDHNPLVTEVVIDDNFDYETLKNWLKPAECKILRSILPTREMEPFLKELETRIKALWPKSKFESMTCGTVAREASCDRPIVFSAEKEDCGEWLGKWYNGCAIVFCD